MQPATSWLGMAALALLPVAIGGEAARAQSPILTPQQAARQSYLRNEPLRENRARLQIDAIDTMRWWGGLPSRYTGLRGAPSLAAIYSGATTGLVDGNYVFEPWPYVPGDIFGFQWDDLVAQPIGNRITFNGPNRYTYEPVFPQPQEVAPPAAAVVAERGPAVAAATPAVPPLLARPPFDPAPFDPAPFDPAPLGPGAPGGDGLGPVLPPDQALAEASRTFRRGDSQGALTLIEQVPPQAPKRPLAELLKSHALFAIGEFEESANALRIALAQLPPQKWGLIMKSFRDYYPNTDRYTEQLRALEAFVAREPRSAAGRFLLGYHYGYLGYAPEAAAELHQVLLLSPGDNLTNALLGVFEPVEAAPAPREPQAAAGRRVF